MDKKELVQEIIWWIGIHEQQTPYDGDEYDEFMDSVTTRVRNAMLESGSDDLDAFTDPELDEIIRGALEKEWQTR